MKEEAKVYIYKFSKLAWTAEMLEMWISAIEKDMANSNIFTYQRIQARDYLANKLFAVRNS